MTEPRARIPALDGIRGIAALAVLLFHAGYYLDAPWLAGHGALAVDVFFVMSGIVVARAYGARLDAGWSPGAFAQARIVRLYPLYLLGTLFGFALQLAVCRWSDPAGTVQVLALMLVASLLLMPLFTSGGNQVFPLNGPSWSLAIEALLNAAFALFGHRWSTRRIAAATGLAALVVAAAAAAGIPPLLGGRSATLWLDVARGVFGFGAGMLVERLDRRGAFARLGGPSSALVLAAATALLMVPRTAQDVWFDPLAILVLSPAVVIAALASRPSPATARLCLGAGAISYPLYILHAPVIDLTALGALHGTPFVSLPVDLAAASALCLLLAAAVARWVEPAVAETARRWARRLGRPAAGPLVPHAP
ncbi:acyltransferase family protein [Methylobacterium sp. sgz302541]|uniref:acyltransferase family protein n=1 Tax=unclassified Methylobacterium TaxID=2615210 RepID=UPI003D35269E